MKTNQSALVAAALIGLATIGSNRVFAETEPNNSPETANPLIVPLTTNGTGVTVSGKLRAGNTTPIPPDRDVFVFTNLHKFTSFQVKIQFTGIDGAETASWAISDATTSLKGGLSNSTVNEVVPAPAAGVPLFVAAIDYPGLTSASGEGDYTIEIIGIAGVDPIAEAVAVAVAAANAEAAKALEAAIAAGILAVEEAKAAGAKAVAEAIAAGEAKAIAAAKAAVDKALARVAKEAEIVRLTAAVTKAKKAYAKAKTPSNKRKLNKATADLSRAKALLAAL
ncbi:MAG: hypothetical protein RLZZ214_3198 [Verrucomicrobiota bacterium]|jgi:hypothetical protein